MYKLIADVIVVTCKAVLKRILFSSAPDSTEGQDSKVMENTEDEETVMDVEEDFTAIIGTSDTPIVEKPKKEEKGGSRGFFMYLGDTVPSFYRRPHSSPDGVLTVIPCGKRDIMIVFDRSISPIRRFSTS